VGEGGEVSPTRKREREEIVISAVPEGWSIFSSGTEERHPPGKKGGKTYHQIRLLLRRGILREVLSKAKRKNSPFLPKFCKGKKKKSTTTPSGFLQEKRQVEHLLRHHRAEKKKGGGPPLEEKKGRQLTG